VLLRIAARVEAASLLLLLANLATVHLSWIATLVGPLHGCAYLLVIGTVLPATGAVLPATGAVRPATRGRRARWLSLVPGVGGLLAERSISTAPAPRAPAEN
jgi:hypothetical protein